MKEINMTHSAILYQAGYRPDEDVIVIAKRMRNLLYLFDIEHKLTSFRKYYQSHYVRKEYIATWKDIKRHLRELLNGKTNFYVKSLIPCKNAVHDFVYETYVKSGCFPNHSPKEILAAYVADFYTQDLIYDDLAYYGFLHYVCDMICWLFGDRTVKYNKPADRYYFALDYLQKHHSEISLPENVKLYKATEGTYLQINKHCSEKEKQTSQYFKKMALKDNADEALANLTFVQKINLALNLPIIVELYHCMESKRKNAEFYINWKYIMDYLTDGVSPKKRYREITVLINETHKDNIIDKAIVIAQILSRMNCRETNPHYDNPQSLSAVLELEHYADGKDCDIYLFMELIASIINSLTDKGIEFDQFYLKEILVIHFFDLENEIIRKINKESIKCKPQI